MSSQRPAAGKMNQQPLAARLHLLDGLAGERRVVVEAREQRIRRAESGDRLARSARPSARAVRKMVSPSGTDYCTSPGS
jgi:hypothetical protein